MLLSSPLAHLLLLSSPHPPLHGHGADVPPAPLQAAHGLHDGVVLSVVAVGVSVVAVGVGVVQQDVAERQHGGHGLRVLLDVPLELLQVQSGSVRTQRGPVCRSVTGQVSNSSIHLELKSPCRSAGGQKDGQIKTRGLHLGSSTF